jgi:protein-tyrosine-phosphatase
VIHQAKNICEEAIFVATGKTKGERTFQILFVDEQNSGPSQLAEHFTRKAFPQSGRYRSAGWQAADDVAPDYQAFANTVGVDLGKAWPTSLSTLAEQLDEFQFVVGLGKGARQKIGRVPFHTTVVEWDIDMAAGPDGVYRQLTPRVREMMERLRGDQAS